MEFFSSNIKTSSSFTLWVRIEQGGIVMVSTFLSIEKVAALKSNPAVI